MEKGYRKLRCSGCPCVLRINVTVLHYGKRIVVTCPKCSTKTATTIPVPAEVHDQENPFLDALKSIFDDPLGRKK